jgi:hypothetical protein
MAKSKKLGGGGRFQALKTKVAASYRKKGMSSAKAAKVGAGVAAKVGMKKYGKAKMTKMAVKGRKRGKK